MNQATPFRAKIVLSASEMKFAAAHFTIFSATQRESLHGHNFELECVLETDIVENGMAFDYTNYKLMLAELCASLDELTLIPTLSRFFKLQENKKEITCLFTDGNRIILPVSDVKLLPVENITIEALAHWFLCTFKEQLPKTDIAFIHSIEMTLSSSPSQSGKIVWKKNH